MWDATYCLEIVGGIQIWFSVNAAYARLDVIISAPIAWFYDEQL